MKTPYVLGALVIVIIVAGFVWHGSSTREVSTPLVATTTEQMMATTTQDAAQTPSVTTKTTTTVTTTAATPAVQHFTVNGNDETADLKTITVPAGTKVSITFGADAGTTYHGGLDYRSSVVSTGTIVPGSTKTVSFTATKSFSFTPYWPASNIAKPYTIDVVVK